MTDSTLIARLRQHASRMLAERIEEIDDDTIEDPSELETDLQLAASALEQCATYREASVKTAGIVCSLQAQVEKRDEEIDNLRLQLKSFHHYATQIKELSEQMVS